MQWIKRFARVLCVTVHEQVVVRRAYSARGVWGHIPLDNFAKSKRFWCVFYRFQPMKLMYPLDLNDKVLFTLPVM